MYYITTHDSPATGLRGIGDTTWQHHGACNGLKPKVADRIFFPTARNSGSIAQAKAICGRCPVLETCLNAAIDTGTKDGIWGGRTEAERERSHARAAHRLEYNRVRAVVAGRDIPLSTRERAAVAREAVLRGWTPRRLATVLGFTVKHSRDLMGKARHELHQATGGAIPATPPAPEPQDAYEDERDDMTTGAEEFDALEGPTDAELAQQDADLGQAA
ncbi:WhiB family transcriptional regulator, redox-sensing transcriptional regulator [Actinacidiphila rubida]|uniref:Transcriptional regulator WhiB n=1 Tax=Actinacidiphila rubida TaxID=310780 RepID=A0A1H8S6D0_9ACTN|nr:WhiB family transcriptional regulator [Actinacidiphila rubida]SEO74097.1 WhiB family transcriptional regulator, redox-sensing transcriptional regulator [Actinacidiphila rubida]